MKKSNILIAAAAILISAATFAKAEEIKIDFDGKKSLTLFELLAEQAKVAEIPAPSGIPARIFTAPEQLSMDRSLESAIAFAVKRQLHPGLIAGLECLLKNGTPEQKAAFVEGKNKSVYEFPAVCGAQAGQPGELNKGIVDSSLQWLCESYNDVIEYLSCHKGPDGEEVCDTKLKTILRQSCHWG